MARQWWARDSVCAVPGGRHHCRGEVTHVQTRREEKMENKKVGVKNRSAVSASEAEFTCLW